MKICYIGSRHNSVFKTAVKKYMSPKEEFIFLDDGVEYFYESIKGDLNFFNKISDTDIFLLDFLSDSKQKPERYEVISEFYQKLIWYIHSICPRSEINLVNFLSFEESLGRFSKFLLNFKPKSCRMFQPESEQKIYSPEDEEIINTCIEILKPNHSTFTDFKDVHKDNQIEDSAPTKEGKLSLIASKLESKKDFKTVTSFPPVLKKK